MFPYGRLPNSDDADEEQAGSAGSIGSRTETFTLASLYYVIHYGFDIYADLFLMPDNPYKHGPEVVTLLQNMRCLTLDGKPFIDDFIHKCWYNEYATVAEPGRAHRQAFEL